MAKYSPEFNAREYELRGSLPTFLTSDQKSEVAQITSRATDQIDWVAQILGWSGNQYWYPFVSSVDQRRQLLAGTFGVYNSFVYPEVLEVRNWENSVIVKGNLEILEGDVFYVGQNTYPASRVEPGGAGKNKIYFETADASFYSSINQGFQLKLADKRFLPAPIVRPSVAASSDFGFHCKEDGEKMLLFPGFDLEENLPFKQVHLYKGGKYSFDKPVTLKVNTNTTLQPKYVQEREEWELHLPETPDFPYSPTAELRFKSSKAIVGIKDWADPSDWYNPGELTPFRGVWSEKGGYRPLHYVFDALSLHGYKDSSIFLEKIERGLKFDDLLNFVYYQRSNVSEGYQPKESMSQVWWNSETGSFSIYNQDPLRCGPWVEVDYPEDPERELAPDFIFPNVQSFRSYSSPFEDKAVVKLLDSSGLGSDGAIYNMTSGLTASGEALLVYETSKNGWLPLLFSYADVGEFSQDAKDLPVNVKVEIEDSSGLKGVDEDFTVANLQITVEGQYKTSLMKYEKDGSWYLSPPSHLKYIGRTRLFASSLDYDNPVEGEMLWDFNEPNPNLRGASIYVYNRWEIDSNSGQPLLKGDWVQINDKSQSATPPEGVDFGVILVYCNGSLVNPGEPFIDGKYEFSYTVNSTDGLLEFSCTPTTPDGFFKLPRVEISDSITSSYVFDITDLVFSGLTYYMAPDVSGSEKLLRVVKYDPLYCIDQPSLVNSERFPNGLVAGENSGPGDELWERYFLRLPIDYQRNGSEWQKINLVCQSFGYWGSSPNSEKMTCPAQQEKPEIYEELYLYNKEPSSSYIYEEPYLYSASVKVYASGGDYDNSAVVPSPLRKDTVFQNSEVYPYDPLHERRANTSSPINKGFGDWEGVYYRATECSFISGFLSKDLEDGTLDPVTPPVWDASIYKFPQSCILDEESGEVDANHYKVGYAYFVAGYSAAGEAVFHPG